VHIGYFIKGESVMKKNLLLSTLISGGIMLFSASAIAKQGPNKRFKKWDANGDSNISYDESVTRAEEKFTDMDTNKDGFVDKQEVQAHHEKHHTTADKKEKFASQDTNKDGFLTKDEMSKIYQRPLLHLIQQPMTKLALKKCRPARFPKNQNAKTNGLTKKTPIAMARSAKKKL